MIFAEDLPNPHIREFNVRRRLTESSILMYNSKDWERIEIADMGLLRKLTSIFFGEGGRLMRHEHNEMMKNKKLIDALFDINGVQSVTLTQFSVSIEKGKAFEWANLNPSIRKVLQKYNLDA